MVKIYLYQLEIDLWESARHLAAGVAVLVSSFRRNSVLSVVSPNSLMNPSGILKIAAAVGVGFLATSCACFPNNRVPKVADSPAPNGKKVAITYSLASRAEALNGLHKETVSVENVHAEEPLTAALTKSGRFSSMSRGKGGNVHLDVEMLNYGNHGAAAVSGFISGFSLLTIPAFATDNYKLTATASTSSGKSRQYVLDDGVTTVIWLPFIVTAPFSNPVTAVPKVQENMYRNLIEKMESDGMISKAAN